VIVEEALDFVELAEREPDMLRTESGGPSARASAAFAVRSESAPPSGSRPRYGSRNPGRRADWLMGTSPGMSRTSARKAVTAPAGCPARRWFLS